MNARATIGFGFTSEWLKKWRENFELITEWSNAKPKQFADYFRHFIENRSIWSSAYPRTYLDNSNNCPFYSHPKSSDGSNRIRTQLTSVMLLQWSTNWDMKPLIWEQVNFVGLINYVPVKDSMNEIHAYKQNREVIIEHIWTIFSVTLPLLSDVSLSLSWFISRFKA